MYRAERFMEEAQTQFKLQGYEDAIEEVRAVREKDIQTEIEAQIALSTQRIVADPTAGWNSDAPVLLRDHTYLYSGDPGDIGDLLYSGGPGGLLYRGRFASPLTKHPNLPPRRQNSGSTHLEEPAEEGID
jgi:hypothetical protein